MQHAKISSTQTGTFANLVIISLYAVATNKKLMLSSQNLEWNIHNEYIHVSLNCMHDSSGLAQHRWVLTFTRVCVDSSRTVLEHSQTLPFTSVLIVAELY